MIRLADPFAVLLTPPPALHQGDVAEVLRRFFNLEGRLSPLVSERDQNFSLLTATGKQFVVKISNPAEDPQVTDFQNSALDHIHKADPRVPVPAVTQSVSGDKTVPITDADGRTCRMRVLTWLSGVTLQSRNSQCPEGSLGHWLARLDSALAGLTHPAQHFSLLWDISQTVRLSEILAAVEDPEARDICRRHISHFEAVVSPAVSRFRKQVIYNDMNPHNVLVDIKGQTRVVGIIDFSDIVHAPLVFDVAVACAYVCRTGSRPFDGVYRLLGAYARVIALRPEEIRWVFDLIQMRFTVGVVIANWSAARFPENRSYIMENEKRARSMLALMDRCSRDAVTARFASACGIGI